MHYQRKRKAIVIFTAIFFHCVLVFHLLFSPVIIVLASNKGIINASFFSFVIIFLLSLFFGRAYCAWFCPGCGVQEIIGKFVKKKVKNTNAKYIKYIIFFLWVTMIIAGYLIRGFTQIDLSYGMTDIPIQRKIFLTAGVALIMVPLAIRYGKYASCKFICWQAPIMILGKRIRDVLHIPGLRIQINNDNCVHCGACSKQCPMDIDIMKQINHGELIDDECILCGNCIETCKFKALNYNFSRPNRSDK